MEPIASVVFRKYIYNTGDSYYPAVYVERGRAHRPEYGAAIGH